MMKRVAFTLILMLLLAVAAHAVVVSEEVSARFKGRVLAPIEGVWSIPNGFAIAIERGSQEGGDYVVTMLQSPNLAMRTPLVVGYVKESPAGDYELVIHTNMREGALTDRISFDAKLRKDGRMALSHRSQLPRVRLSAIFRSLGPVIGVSKNIEFKGVDYLAGRVLPAPAPSAANPIAL